MKFIIANYGLPSIALIQWAIEQPLDSWWVLSVDTGWQSQRWQTHLDKVFAYLSMNKVQFRHLKSQKTFQECVLDRQSFPSVKFQWCAPFLKGLTLNCELDELDPACQAEILLPKMRLLSRANKQLSSGLENENYLDRTVQYPLLDLSLDARDALIERTGLSGLFYNSEECLPCIHSSPKEVAGMSERDKSKLKELEQTLAKPMLFNDRVEGDAGIERYDMGCGNIWGCGE